MNHKSNEHAQKYRENFNRSLWLSGDVSTFFAEYKAQKLREWFPEKEYQKVSILDFGCGDGLMTSFVKHIFVNAEIFGVDPSRDSIDIAQQAYDGIHFSPSDDTLHFDDNSFDFIYSAGVFHHIEFEQHEQYRDELMRVLKPGGTLLLFELNPLNLATVYTFKTNPLEKDATMMTPWYTKKLLKPYGTVTIRFCCFFTTRVSKLRVLEPYMAWLPFGALYGTNVTKSKEQL